MRFSASCQATRSDRLSGKRNRRSFAPMTSSENSSSMASGNLTKLPPQFWRFQQAHESVRQRRRILARDNNPAVLFAASEDICNSWRRMRPQAAHAIASRAPLRNLPVEKGWRASAARRYDHSSRRSNTCGQSTAPCRSNRRDVVRRRGRGRLRPARAECPRLVVVNKYDSRRLTEYRGLFRDLDAAMPRNDTRIAPYPEPGPDDVPIGWLRTTSTGFGIGPILSDRTPYSV